MATQLICDGCRTPLYRSGKTSQENGGVTPATGCELLVEGSRVDGLLGGSPLPQGNFHWCKNCARIAFQAVQEAQFRKAGLK